MIKLKDLEYVITPDTSVGITDRARQLPLVDSWGSWTKGGLKTLDVKVLSISSCGYLLIILDI